MPCSLACSAAFCMTSSVVSPRITCLQPLDGSTFAHSKTFAMAKSPSFKPIISFAHSELLSQYWIKRQWLLSVPILKKSFFSFAESVLDKRARLGYRAINKIGKRVKRTMYYGARGIVGLVKPTYRP